MNTRDRRPIRTSEWRWSGWFSLALWLVIAPAVEAQPRPYIGFVYPAGGQQGATFALRLGGQGLDEVKAVLVTGTGVSGHVVEYLRKLNNQEVQLLNEQLRELRRISASSSSMSASPTMAESSLMMSDKTTEPSAATDAKDETARKLISRIEMRTRNFVQTPACDSIASLVLAELTIAADAEPGQREIRLLTPRGVSNPLIFHVGQLPEISRPPMPTSPRQVLGKEAMALRKRPANEVDERIKLPCTVNGQIASGEVNRYRFEARQGQPLVINTLGRQLIPFIADAVPGWFQPVLALYDAQGKEVAFSDDYRFRPDPVILYQVPEDGEYVLTIHDSLYRGREDFVYRISLGELPFVTSLFPLGGRLGHPVTPKMQGWNLDQASLVPLAADAGPGLHWLAANQKGFISNRVPFELDDWPEAMDNDSHNTPASAQEVQLPVVINGRLDAPNEWDVFQFQGQANEMIVAEVQARRLESPLDSVLKLTDANGTLLAYNDDCEDLGAALNTHHADSYFKAKLPADGLYYVHLGDTARQGGQEYGYRLRLSAPQPDFALRAVPSSVSFRGGSSAIISVYVIRKDGFTGPIKLTLKDPPPGFSASAVTLSGTQAMARLTVRCTRAAAPEPVNLAIAGTATIDNQVITREAIPAEDRMQAFLWRHLVPASDLKALAYNSPAQLQRRRATRVPLPSTNTTNVVVSTNPVAGTNATQTAANKPKFTKQQIAGRLRQLALLYDQGLLTDEFHDRKVAECEAAQ